MEKQKLRLGCVVMAAGNARRFGENKLLAEVEGKSLIRRALEAVPAERFNMVAVVTQYLEVERLAVEFGFQPVRNDRPDLGVSYTIRLGLETLEGCDAVLFMVSDQPRLRRETVAAELDFFREHPERIVALSHGGQRGNPCVFPAKFFPELLALEGDRGGSAVIRRHQEELLLFEVGQAEMEDVDTPQELGKIKGN